MKTELPPQLETSAQTFPKVQIKYFGSIRVAVNKSEEELELASNTTAYQLLQNLTDVYGKSLRDEIFQDDGDGLRKDLMVTLNKTIVEHTSAAATGLHPGDEVGLYPLFLGGG